MPVYKCVLCNFSTTLKGNIKQHNKTNKHRNKLLASENQLKEQGVIIQNNPKIIQNNPVDCKNNPAIIQNNPVDAKFTCDYCGKTFTMRANKRRHEMHRCKENPEFLDKLLAAKNNRIKTLQQDKDNLEKDKRALEKDKEALREEKQELYKQVATLLDKVGDTNIQNNIILNNFGNEDLTHITDTLKTELLRVPYGAIPKMIEAIHFNAETPENKNIMIPNKKDTLVKVFEGDKWIYKNKSDTITDLVDSKYTIIDEHYEGMDNKQKVPSSIKTTFTKFKKIYEAGDEEMVANLKKQCELVLLNNR